MKVNIPCKNTFSDEVVVHLNVLCLSMKDEVSTKMDTVEIVVVEQDWIVDGDVQILKTYPLKPYGFTCSHHQPLYSASMLKRATIGCFLLLYNIALLPREKTISEVDCLSDL